MTVADPAQPPTVLEQLAGQLSRDPMEVIKAFAAINDKVAILGQLSERARELERVAPLADDTLHGGDVGLAEWEHRVVLDAIASGNLTWRQVLLDATFAAYSHREWPELRAALVTVAAECVNWILDGDRRE